MVTTNQDIMNIKPYLNLPYHPVTVFLHIINKDPVLSTFIYIISFDTLKTFKYIMKLEKSIKLNKKKRGCLTQRFKSIEGCCLPGLSI